MAPTSLLNAPLPKIMKMVVVRPEGRCAQSRHDGARLCMLFKPGDAAPHSGLYEAIHHSHRENHTVSVTAGAHFPDCNVCDGDVRFRFVRSAAPIEFDEDFR